MKGVKICLTIKFVTSVDHVKIDSSIHLAFYAKFTTVFILSTE